MTDLVELAKRVEAAKHTVNTLDVQVEIALFKPGTAYKAIRANNAGTKVIYTDAAGNDVTCWADDWTLGTARRKATAAAIRALAAQGRGE
jgi:hypothetical protein